MDLQLLVGRSTGKNKIAFHILKTPSQDRTTLLSEEDFASGCFCLSERVEEIRRRQAGSGLATLRSSILSLSDID